MTYILNAIVVGQGLSVGIREDAVVAEPDDPPDTLFSVGEEVFSGMRYLLVTDDGTGYTSSDEFVDVPRHSEQATVLSVPDAIKESFRRALVSLLASSPTNQLVVYLEANRYLSRPDSDDISPVPPMLLKHPTFDRFWRVVEDFELEEDIVHVIGNSACAESN